MADHRPSQESFSSGRTPVADVEASSPPDHIKDKQEREKAGLEQPPHLALDDHKDAPLEEQKHEQNNDVESSGPPTPGPPRDGGLVAWLHVLAGFMILFNTWGIMNAFAVFQTYYESGALFKASSSEISWIGSIQAFMVLFMGIITGPLYDRGYMRSLLWVGAFGVVFGHMMLSICKEYWQVLLAQGFCVGIGAGCIFITIISIMPTYFSKHIGLAFGLVVAGSSTGGVIYPIVLYKLLAEGEASFGWSVRAMAFIALGTLSIPIALMRLRVRPAKPRAMIDYTAFTDWHFVMFTLTTVVAFTGMSVMLFYFAFYGQAKGFTDEAMSFYIVPIFSGASFFGRTIPSAVSDKIGPFNTIGICTTILGIVVFCEMTITAEAGIIVMAVFTGFFSGVLVSMPPLCIAALTANKSLIGTRAGMSFATVAFGFLAGGPAAGKILGTQGSFDWTGLWSYSGACLTAAGLLYCVLRVWRSGPQLFIKA